jgi:hypothetical protein
VSRESEGELVLQGALKSTHYDGKLITYGLSAYGPVLWLFGFPAGTITNDLAVKLRLVDRAPQTLLWGKEYQGQHSTGPFWLYAMPEDFYYDTTLKELMPTILSDLEAASRRSSKSDRGFAERTKILGWLN